MFVKLRTNRYMKAIGRDDAALVEFTGKIQRMAKVHQYGLKDRPNVHAQEVQYDERQLLGLNQNDFKKISLLIMCNLIDFYK